MSRGEYFRCCCWLSLGFGLRTGHDGTVMTSDVQHVVRGAPPSKFVILLWLAGYLVIACLLISGHLAQPIHRLWSGTVLLPGIMSDLPTLTKIYRWAGIAMLLLFAVMCAVALLR
jgi:hypothetical protein